MNHYGKCPICGAPGLMRERRPNGDDECENGHKYPSRQAIPDDKLEQVAALEHEQWAHWTKYMLDNMTQENLVRWREQIAKPYSELSEQEKESDRVWARKVMNILD